VSVPLGVAVLCVCSSTAIAGGVNIPDWVRQAAGQPNGTYSPETRAAVLLDQTDYTVIAPGEYVEHSRRVVRILRPEGREEGELRVDLGQKEKLNNIHAWTIDRSGHEYELKQKDFVERSFPSFVLYDDIRFLAAKAPASDPGSVIAFEYECRRHSYLSQINQYFQEPNPAREVRISLTLPAGWEFKDSWPVAFAIKPVQSAPNHWEWVAHDVPGIEEERMMPAKHVLMGRLVIAYFAPGEVEQMGSWAALGRWYARLTNGRRDATPEIKEQVQRLIAGKSDFDSKLRVLAAFVQSEVRYVAIEIGIGGYQPHPAGDIYRFRYGDCKDKATLLSAMLRVAGISSEYVAIHTHRGFVNPSVPSAWFNHVILAIELPGELKGEEYQSRIVTEGGKRYIIFDPTDEYTPVGALRAELQGSHALLVTDSSGELIRTPLLSPDANTLTRTGYFYLKIDGGLAGEVSEDRGGDFASHERGRLHNSDERERTNYFEHYLGRSIQGFTIESLDIQQAGQPEKNVLIKYKFSAPQYAQQRGPLMLVRPRVLGEKGEHVERKPRHFPIVLEQTARETDTYEIEIPKEYTVDDIPDPVNIDVGFASYHSKIDVAGSKLRYWREYVVRDLSVPPEKFDDWAKLQGVIGADESAAVVLKRVQ
jgi:hypothetical protein